MNALCPIQPVAQKPTTLDDPPQIQGCDEHSRCISCAGQNYFVRLSQEDFEIRECTHCTLAWTYPPSTVSAASYAHSPTFAVSYAGREELTAYYANALLDSVSPHLRGNQLLDVGCSVGSLVEAAAARGFVAAGIDLDVHAVAFGKERNRSVEVSELSDWTGGPYNVICLQHTLEHIPEPITFLRECRGHLAAQGCVAISVPCHDGLLPRLFARRWYGWQPNQHYFHYSRKSLALLLEAAGFFVETCFQNSMDHRPPSKAPSLKIALKHRVMHTVATAGAFIGWGDQLIAVGRRVNETA